MVAFAMARRAIAAEHVCVCVYALSVCLCAKRKRQTKTRNIFRERMKQMEKINKILGVNEREKNVQK